MADISTSKDIYSDHLSRKLCQVLDYVGLSETMRKVWMEYGLATEAFLTLRTHFMKRPLDMFKFGSGIEGSTVPGLHSDLDLLLLHDIPVIGRIDEAPENGLCYLLVCDPDTPAGFVKFQVVKDRAKLTGEDKDGVQPEENYSVDKHGRLVRNNNTLLQDKLNKAWRSGPAQTCEDKNFGSLDYVEGYHCSSWPELASEWLLAQQDRENSNIVTKEQVAEFEKMGCFFVGIGKPNSSESHLEWRISLSSQERSLMFNMNQIQFKCYVMLKILKEEFIKPITGKSLSSYHCKTALFHVMEQEDSKFWVEENLIGAVFHCLQLLLEWVRQGECPNFFVRKENMFECKLQGDDVRVQLVNILEDMINKGHDILFDIKCDKIGELLDENGNSFKPEGMSMDAWENLYRIHLDTVCEFCQSKDRVHGLLGRDSDPAKCTEGLTGLLSDLQTMTSLRLHDICGIMTGVQYFIPHTQTCLGSNLIACALQNGPGKTENKSLVEKGLAHLREGIDAFFLSGKLKYASCLFALGKLDNCLDILKELEQRLEPSTATACACRHIEYAMNHDLVQKLVQQKCHERADVCLRQMAQTSICMCVSFQPSEMAITPFPLRYEMFRSFGSPDNSVGGFGVYWYQAACVDAKVFLYFLKYLVHSARKETDFARASVESLLLIEKEDPALNHRETTFNLLSWIHQREGNLTEAARYCVKSWNYLVEMEENVVSSVHPHHNAVKWHVLRILFDIWWEKSRG